VSDPIDIGRYARERKLSRSVVSRWIRERGAPVVRRGGRGPGQATLVDAVALDAWRGLDASSAEIMLDQVAEGLLDTVLRNGPRDEPVHYSIGISRRQAAALLVFAFERAAQRVLGRDATLQPPPIVQLCTIVQTG
jgi:hypothetical protein